MRVPPIKIRITEDTHGKIKTPIKAWLYVNDHGQDLRFYTQDKKKEIINTTVIVWELGWKYDKAD